jgi:hypothetical protein
MEQNLDVEAAAKRYCRRLLDSKSAHMLPKDRAEALVILAFTFGAAWALDRPDMVDLAEAQIDSARSAQQ